MGLSLSLMETLFAGDNCISLERSHLRKLQIAGRACGTAFADRVFRSGASCGRALRRQGTSRFFRLSQE